jgi:hypothetical protein
MTRSCGVACAIVLLMSACTGDDGAAETTTPLTREELLKPETCKKCHVKHYREWSASMHAYATQDPVFIAMNKRGQREAKVGEFCVNCHAPMAVREQPNTDWTKTDPSELPKQLQGVTCYFCHNAIGTDGDHNNAIRLANDTTMRGSIRDPVDPKVHGVAYSEFNDRESPKSSAMCGGCHDIQTKKGVHLERTFEEFRSSLFSKASYDGALSCQGCHMPGTPGVAANVPGLVNSRSVHEHLWPGVDVPLTDWPHREALRAAVEECQLPNSVNFLVQANTDDGVGSYAFSLETNAGHRQPSGASQDRRMWLEVKSTSATGETLLDTGSVADDAVEVAAEGKTALWSFHDTIYDEDGKEVHMFWDAALPSDPASPFPEGYNSTALPELRTAVAGGHSLTQVYPLSFASLPASADVRLRMRPMGMQVLQDLVDSKDLDPAIIKEMPTFTAYSAKIEWPPGSGQPEDFTVTPTTPPDCDRYRCLLDPKSSACDTVRDN